MSALAQSLIITGTDTEIGKTYTTSILALYLQGQGYRVAIYKPIQTGCQRKDSEGSWIAPDLELSQKICPAITVEATYRLALPATPALAATEEGIEIHSGVILASFERLCKDHDFVLVEGAGGLYVPISEDRLMVDLLASFEAPSLLVARNQLGTINHTGLSAVYGQAKGLRWSGFVFSPPLLSTASLDRLVQSTNARFIEQFTGLSFLGHIPSLEVDQYIDRLSVAIEVMTELSPLAWFASKI